MTKLKTLLLLLLAGFILVACGSDEEEVVDPRADDKAALASMFVDQGLVLNSNTADCVVSVLSENLDDDAWTLLTLFVKVESDGDLSDDEFKEITEFILVNDIDEDAIDKALEAAGAKAEAECEVDLD